MIAGETRLNAGAPLMTQAMSLVAVILFAASAWFGGSASAVLPPPQIGTLAIEHLRTGDILFRSGVALDSRVVRMFDPGTHYSHVGLAEVQSGVAYVLHIEPGSTPLESHIRREPLLSFLGPRQADDFAVYRVVPSDALRGERAVTAAIRYQRAGVSFDYDFDLATEDAMYCSELVYRAYNEAGVDLSDDRLVQPSWPLRHPLLRISSLINSRHVTRIF